MWGGGDREGRGDGGGGNGNSVPFRSVPRDSVPFRPVPRPFRSLGAKNDLRSVPFRSRGTERNGNGTERKERNGRHP